jgi:hypothetical protein
MRAQQHLRLGAASAKHPFKIDFVVFMASGEHRGRGVKLTGSVAEGRVEAQGFGLLEVRGCAIGPPFGGNDGGA